MSVDPITMFRGSQARYRRAVEAFIADMDERVRRAEVALRMCDEEPPVAPTTIAVMHTVRHNTAMRRKAVERAHRILARLRAR